LSEELKGLTLLVLHSLNTSGGPHLISTRWQA
jgi:hypothetical protein